MVTSDINFYLPQNVHLFYFFWAKTAQKYNARGKITLGRRHFGDVCAQL